MLGHHSISEQAISELAPAAAGLVTAAGTITFIGTAIASGTNLAAGTTTTIGTVIASGTGIVFAAGTSTVIGTVVATAATRAFATITIIGDVAASGIGFVYPTATSTFIGDLVADGVILSNLVTAAGTITIIGDVAATGTGFVYPLATVTFIGDVAANGKSLTAATIDYIATLIAGGGQHSAIATTTTIGNLAAIGTDISSGIVTATGTITFLSQVAASGTQLASGTSVFIGELVANGGIAVSLATGTIFIGSEAGDPLWSQTQFLADFEGADAATSYTEKSTNAAVATFNNNAQLDTTDFNSGASALLLDGSGDDVSFPDIAAYDLAPSGAQDWTIECFVRFDSVLSNPEQRELMGQYGAGGNAWSMGFQADVFSNQRIRVRPDGQDEVASIPGFAVGIDTWYHYVMQRQGDNLYVGMNGRRVLQSTAPFSGGQITSSEPIRIGSNFGVAADAWHGSVDDVRITIGSARYADLSAGSTYAVPTTPFPIGSSVPALSAVGTAITPATATVAVIGTLGVGGGTQFATATIIIIGDQAGGGGTQYAQGTITTIGDLVATGTAVSPVSLVFASGSISLIGSIDAKGRSFCPIKAYGTISIIGSLSAVELYDTLIVKARATIGVFSRNVLVNLYSDNFDRSELGSNWQTGVSHQISTNGFGRSAISNNKFVQATYDTWSTAYWKGGALNEDQWAEIEVSNMQGFGHYNFMTVELRSDVGKQTGQALYIDWGGGEDFDYGTWIGFVRFDGPLNETYWSPSPYLANGVPDGSIIRAEVQGNRYRIFLNNQLIVDAVDATNMGVGREIGIQAFHFNSFAQSNAANQPAIDNFRAGNIVNTSTSYWNAVVNDTFDSGMREDLWINGPAMEDRHYYWYPPLPDNGDGTLGLQGWSTYAGSLTPPEDDLYWWNSDWPAAITRRRYFADQACEIDYGGWNKNNGQFHHVSVSLRSDILDEKNENGEYDSNEIETNLWVTLDYDGGIYTGSGNSEVRVFKIDGQPGIGYSALSPRINIGAIPDSGTFRVEVVGYDVRILINGNIVYNYKLPVTFSLSTHRDPKFYGHVVLWSYLYWDNNNDLTGLNDNPLFIPADQAFDDFNWDFSPEFLYRPPRQTPFETHYIDAARIYEWVYIPGNLAARGTIITTNGRFNAYGSINIEGHLSQATLNKETCITPTATLTVPAAVMSASGTDLNLKRSFATITVTATLGVSAIYVRASSLAFVGELTALGRNLPIGDLMMQSRAADFSLAGMAGPGTINGQKVFLINIPYDAATIYNNSLGGFFTISGGSTLKEARSLINWRVLMTAIGSKDQTKFAIGTVNMIGAVTAKGMHKASATIVYVPTLAATGGRTPTGTITFFSQLYAAGPQAFAPTYNGAQNPSEVAQGIGEAEYSNLGPGTSSAQGDTHIYVRNGASDTVIYAFSTAGGGPNPSYTMLPAATETAIFNLNVRADTVKIRLVSSSYTDSNHTAYPSTVAQYGTAFTDNSAFNPTNGVNHGYRGLAGVNASDPPGNPPTGSEYGWIIPVIEFTFTKAGYTPLVVTYRGRAEAIAVANDES